MFINVIGGNSIGGSIQSCPKIKIVNKLRLKGVCGAVWITY